MELNRPAALLAAFVKQEGELKGKTLAAKLLLFLELERGISTGLDFKEDKYGYYDEEGFEKAVKELEDKELVKVKQETSRYGTPKYIYSGKQKLGKITLPLTEKEIFSIKATWKQYHNWSADELSAYCKEMYIDKKVEDVCSKIKDFRKKQDEEYVRKANGNKEKAITLYLKETR